MQWATPPFPVSVVALSNVSHLPFFPKESSTSRSSIAQDELCSGCSRSPEKGMQHLQSPKSTKNHAQPISNPWAYRTDRAQIRCDGERPVCKRCSRLKRNCVYSTEAGSSRKSKAIQRLLAAAPSPDERAHLPASARSRNPSVNHDNLFSARYTPTSIEARIPRPLTDERHHGIPKPMLLALVDIYFETAYNASLLLHKPRLLEAIDADTVSPHVLLSICAWAAK